MTPQTPRPEQPKGHIVLLGHGSEVAFRNLKSVNCKPQLKQLTPIPKRTIQMTRRTFFSTAAAAASALTLTSKTAAQSDSPAGSNTGRPNRIAAATYSFWHFDPSRRMPIDQCMRHSAEMGFDAVDILHAQMTNESNAALQSLKQLALRLGLDLCNLSTHQGFVTPDPERRQRSVDHTLRCIDIAYKLGIPCIRISAGRWGTSASFDELMANKGIEPPLPPHRRGRYPWLLKPRIHPPPTMTQPGAGNHWVGANPQGLLRIDNAVIPGSKVVGHRKFPRALTINSKNRPQTVFIQAKPTSAAALHPSIWTTLHRRYLKNTQPGLHLRDSKAKKTVLSPSKTSTSCERPC